MKHLGQPVGTLISHGILGSAPMYLVQPWNTWVSLKGLQTTNIPGSVSRYMGQPWYTWVSLQVLGSAIQQLGHP